MFAAKEVVPAAGRAEVVGRSIHAGGHRRARRIDIHPAGRVHRLLGRGGADFDAQLPGGQRALLRQGCARKRRRRLALDTTDSELIARRWIGALDPCACWTKRTIWASIVSLPTRVARNRKAPVLLMVVHLRRAVRQAQPSSPVDGPGRIEHHRRDHGQLEPVVGQDAPRTAREP